MKNKTILEGEQAVIFNHMGEGRLVCGPARVFLFRERLQKLKRHTASQYEYLMIRDNDGIVTHNRGPCEIFFNPLLHETIHVVSAIKLDANHMVVVYKRLKDGSVQRRIVQGPTVLVPEAEEWLHEFKWHGADPDNKTRMIPGKDKFNQLAVIPEQFYYNVRDVRTNDDTMITVKLMLFFELKDVLKMLDTAHDPIADLINFEQFLAKSHELSELESYPQLLQRAERIGYELQKIVFRGYHSSDQLQVMQNSAIESRTQLRLNAEIEEQKQKLADLRVTKEYERTKQKQEMEKSRQEHRQKLEALKQKHTLELEQMQHSQALVVQDRMNKARIECRAADDNHRIEHLNSLVDLNIDVTAYLTNQHSPPVSEEVQVIDVTGPSSSTRI